MILLVYTFIYYCNIETSIIIEKRIVIEKMVFKRALSYEKALSERQINI